MINGGAGRVIAAIPALEKYHRLNPNDDFRVIVHGWESLYWSHPLLQNRTFGIAQKGLFELLIKNNRVICPEPYLKYGYYNQELSMAEAFDEDINQTNDHADLTDPQLYISSLERNSVNKIIRDKKEETGKSRVLVIQPYGSGIGISNNRPYDSSHRSLDVDEYLKLINKIQEVNKDALIFYFGGQEFRHPGDNITVNFENLPVDLRFFMSLISECDYFVGCDSVGQHMARAFNKPGLIIMGSTDEKNVSYPDHFTIYRNGKSPTYSPIRLTGIDCDFADRLNDGIMNFNDQQIEEIAEIVSRGLYE